MLPTMKRAALALVLVACSSSGKDFPPLHEGSGPGGNVGTGTGPGGTGRDAGIGDGSASDAGVPIAGRVCLIQDLRSLTTNCSDNGAGGLTVTLGAPATDAGTTTTVVGTATTAKDGSFAMVAPIGTGFTWHVTGTNLQTSVMGYGTENIIPAILDQPYLELRSSNTPQPVDLDHGDVVVRVVRGVAPVTGIAATVAPQAETVPHYDSNNSGADWNTIATQAAGVVWIPDAQVGPARVTLRAADGTTITPDIFDTAIEGQAITFLTRTIP
jgi:hypothetical protein